MVLPQKDREKVDAFYLAGFKKQYGLGMVLFFLFLIPGVGIAQSFSLVDTNLPSPQLNLTQQTNSLPSGYEPLKDLIANAEKGDAASQFALGDCYYYGNGVEINHSEAAKWYRKAAEQGEINAQLKLGDMYATLYEAGKGVVRDYGESIKWYRKAADQYRKAAELGDDRAQCNLGLMYLNGEGVPQDYAEAAKWYRKAADQGQVNSQYNLGVQYSKGQGVPQNDIEAYIWLSLAAAQGDVDAPRVRDIVAERMSREEIVEGQRRAAAFVPQKEISNSNSDNPVSSDNPKFSGTGFFITDDGYLISNYHVVKDAVKVRLLTGSGLIDATVVKVDAANDLALLKAVGRFVPLPIAASRTVKLGGTVATVGFPDIGMQGFAPKLANGEIASLAGAADDPRYFQISLPVQHGNSGGALVDVRGNVVGIVAARLGVEIGKAVTSDELPENVNYAVKSSLLLSFLESVPDVDAKLKDPNTKEEAFEDVVKSAEDAAVLVLVY